MVKIGALTKFRNDTSGATLAEGLIVFPLVILVFAAFVEFGFAVFQWNQTVKAIQYGARLAVVSDPLTNDFNTKFPVNAADPANAAKATPNDATIVSTCGPSKANCNVAGLDYIVFGGDTSCTATAGSRPGMCDLNPRIGPDNVVITYQRSGLGYWGRPDGPVLTMRVEVRNITFNLPILGALLGLNTITIPALPVTLTTEDLKTCSTC